MPALGVPRDIERDQPLDRFQFYLRLADALRWSEGSKAAHLKELSDSFSHDVLNLAALASRLLWYEGVTPDMWRSHDLVTVGVDAESYFVMLQSACDMMADVIATVGAEKKGQTPWESFHKLNEWAIKNPKRLRPTYQSLLRKRLPWFSEINEVRTKLVHRGGLLWVYTERVAFEWDIHVQAEGAKVRHGRYLLESLQTLTREMLAFSERLGSRIEKELPQIEQPKKRVIDGVYVPALHHLLRYKVPEKSVLLGLIARCLVVCGGYVEASFVGYPDGFWWQLVLAVAEKTAEGLVSASIHVSPSGLVHDCKFVFSNGLKKCGFVACDQGRIKNGWLKGATKSVQEVQAAHGLDRAALVVREMDDSAQDLLANSNCPVIVGDDPATVSPKLLASLL